MARGNTEEASFAVQADNAVENQQSVDSGFRSSVK
jgi:hypothetical protein